MILRILLVSTLDYLQSCQGEETSYQSSAFFLDRRKHESPRISRTNLGQPEQPRKPRHSGLGGERKETHQQREVETKCAENVASMGHQRLAQVSILSELMTQLRHSYVALSVITLSGWIPQGRWHSSSRLRGKLERRECVLSHHRRYKGQLGEHSGYERGVEQSSAGNCLPGCRDRAGHCPTVGPRGRGRAATRREIDHDIRCPILAQISGAGKHGTRFLCGRTRRIRRSTQVAKRESQASRTT